MKNRIKKIIIVCIILICSIFLVTKLTYSSYESNTKGDVTGNIAGWNIKVNDVVVSNEVDKIVDIDDVVWNASHTRTGKLSPGATGTFNIKLDFSGTDVAVRFDLEIIDKNVDSNKILTLTNIDTTDVTLVRTGVSKYTAVVDVDDIDTTLVNIALDLSWVNNDNVTDDPSGNFDNSQFLEVEFKATQYGGETITAYTG
ncbi:MAG: hypothetical protein IJL76_02295 [Bacilli bacterium]|nr:hypothetical protein [Bacilli bacterium]